MTPPPIDWKNIFQQKFAGPHGYCNPKVAEDIESFIESLLAEKEAEIDRLKESLEVSDKISGTFWEALKPLRIKNLYVENPGAHFTETILELRCKLEAREMDLKQLQKLVDGIDVDNPSAVDTLIDALKIQKENLNRIIQELESKLAQQRQEVLEEVFRKIEFCGFGAMEWRMKLIEKLKGPDTIVHALTPKQEKP